MVHGQPGVCVARGWDGSGTAPAREREPGRRADGGGAGTPAEGRERGRQGPGPAGLMARGLEVTDGEVGSSLQLLGIRSDPQVEVKSILS